MRESCAREPNDKLKGLLRYPTCRAQLEVSAWSEVGRMRELPQMTHLEVEKSGRRNLATRSFWLPNGYFTIPIDEVGPFKLYN